MKVLILMPEYCSVIHLSDGVEEFHIIVIPNEIPLVESALIKQVVEEILIRLGIN
jgi:hypothetical protein